MSIIQQIRDRAAWLVFGLIALIILMDIVDTLLKGMSHWNALGVAYPIRTGAMLVVAGLGMVLTHTGAHLALALFALVYQVIYFAWEYFVLPP